MATYIFESMSDSDASAFTTGDRLIFTSATVGALGVTDVPGSTTSTGLGTTTTAEGITLSENGHSHTFEAGALTDAEVNNNVIFANGDILATGTSGDDDLGATALAGVVATQGRGAVHFGFAGDDTMTGTIANDTVNGGDGNDVITGNSSFTDAGGNFVENDYYLGGAGNDSITGGDGNDHIYGNLFTSVQGSVDGADSLVGGAGNDYIQGNAGNDTILGGLDNDRLYGGGDNDSIDGGAGYDHLQGNMGNDTLLGGADNDDLSGGKGDDSLVGGAGWDTLTGGQGNDMFYFAATDASNANVTTIAAGATTPANHDVTEQIADFTTGQDHIHLAGFTGTVATVLGQAAGVTFTSVDAAQVYAQQLLDNHTGTNEVAHIVVGGDSYLFYNDAGTDGSTINAAIKLTGDTTLLTTTDFV
jgi:serralysin